MRIMRELTYRVPTWAMLVIDGLDSTEYLTDTERKHYEIFMDNVFEPDWNKGEMAQWVFEEGGFGRNDVDSKLGDTHIARLYILAPEK